MAQDLAMDDELLGAFVEEAREHLTTIEADLLAIEEAGQGADPELVNKVFRAAHSIKGASGFLGLATIQQLSHKAETILHLLRSGAISPNAEMTNLLLAAFDRLRQMVANPGESNQTDISDLAAGLTELAGSGLDETRRGSLKQTVSLAAEGGGSPAAVPRFDYERARNSAQHVYRLQYDLIHDLERRGKNPFELFRELEQVGEILDCAVDFEAAGTLDDPIGNRLPLRLVLATALSLEELTGRLPEIKDRIALLSDVLSAEAPAAAAAIEFPAPAQPAVADRAWASEPMASPSPSQAPAESAPAEAHHPVVEETIRVSVGVLEKLLNLAGELVLGRNQLHASIAQRNQRSLMTADQRISQITSELQDVVMQTRLQPIGNVFGKFPRVVRDLAATLKKDIQLEIVGKDVALDKTLLEALSDPLTHMVRNAVDHGVETIEERLRAGKPRQGAIRIEARHEAGQVIVEIADDGRGISGERVAKSAVAKGLIAADKARAMNEQERIGLIFLPGLSTAPQVSDVSGRGVGMDVVKTNLDRLGGKVEILSVVGKGTTFCIKLPLTLAIIPSLIVSVGAERFAIPQLNVEEMLCVLPRAAKTRIEVVGDAEVLVLRERLIPLVRFADFLDRPEAERQPVANGLQVVVVTSGGQTYGLVVSTFHGTEEIVVKPLGAHLKALKEYAGATILGDGTVALIMDVAGLAAKQNLSVAAERARAQQRAARAQTEEVDDRQFLLTFQNAPDELCALPLDMVRRIERIPAGAVQMLGGRRTMQYHGGSLPLVTLADTASMQQIGPVKELAVMITSIRGREVGLVGTMPVDVVETSLTVDRETHRQPGIAGSAIIDGRTALIVDLYELVDATWPEWAAERSAERAAERIEASSEGGDAVLLAEDSDFFRAQVRRMLEEDGHTVLAGADGEAAWKLLVENIGRVWAVVTDVEMPNLDGLGLARRIRADARTAALPIIALTSLAGDDEVAHGKAAGVDEYQIKLDRDQLLERLRTMRASVGTGARATVGACA